MQDAVQQCDDAGRANRQEDKYEAVEQKRSLAVHLPISVAACAVSMARARFSDCSCAVFSRDSSVG